MRYYYRSPKPTQTCKCACGHFAKNYKNLDGSRGGNVEFDERWTTDNMAQVRTNVTNLLELRPDAVLTTGGRVIPIFKQMTQTIPIIMITADPVGAGLVESLARPGGNITGFSVFEFSLIGKMLEILKKIVPEISHVAMIYNTDNPTTSFFVRSFETYTRPLALEPFTKPIRGIDDLDRVITMLAQQPNVGILFPPDVTISALREQVVAAIARHRLPAIYSDPLLVNRGGLVSYSADRVDIYRRAASYVDRILRGEKPSDLPVQEPTKYELVINLKTARALGIAIPNTLIALADEVIE